MFQQNVFQIITKLDLPFFIGLSFLLRFFKLPVLLTKTNTRIISLWLGLFFPPRHWRWRWVVVSSVNLPFPWISHWELPFVPFGSLCPSRPSDRIAPVTSWGSCFFPLWPSGWLPPGAPVAPQFVSAIQPQGSDNVKEREFCSTELELGDS